MEVCHTVRKSCPCMVLMSTSDTRRVHASPGGLSSPCQTQGPETEASASAVRIHQVRICKVFCLVYSHNQLFVIQTQR